MLQTLFSLFKKQPSPAPLGSAPTEEVSFFPRPLPRVEGTPGELQERLKNRYIDRLAERVRKMRRELAARNWTLIKLECRQIAASGASYGCGEIAEAAHQVDLLIPEGDISRARLLKDARQKTEVLIQKIDTFLNTQT